MNKIGGKNKLLFFIKKHYLGLILAVLFGLFSVGPQLLFLQRAGSDFKGIYGEFNGDALYYLSRVQEVIDGYPATNNSYLLEHKNDVYAQTSAPEILEAFLCRIFDLSPAQMQVRLDFILPLLLFFLTYLLFNKFSRSRAISALLTVLFFFITLGPLDKPINPQINLFFLLGFLYLFYNFINRKNKVLWSLTAGIVLGLLINIYFYHWTFLFLFGGLYFLIKLAQKEYTEFKYLPFFLLPALIIGIPYFLLVHSSMASPLYSQVSVRVGMYFTHGVESYPRTLVGLIWVVLFLVFSFKFKIFKDKQWPFFFALILGNVIYPNQQIITGRVLQLALHWSWMPIFIFCITTAYFYQVLRFKKTSKKDYRLILLIILVFLLAPVLRLTSFTYSSIIGKFKNVEYLEYQKYGQAIKWLNEKSRKDEVVYANIKLSHLLPVYTHNNVLFDKYIFNLPASDQEVVERFLVFNWLNPNILQDKNFGLKEGEQLLWNFAHGAEQNVHRLHRVFGIKYVEQYSIAKEAEFINQVYQEIKDDDFIDLLKKFHVSYMIWDEKIDSHWRLDKIKGLEKIKEENNISIWKINI